MTAEEIRASLRQWLNELQADIARAQAAIRALDGEQALQEPPIPQGAPVRARVGRPRKLAKRMPPEERDKTVLGVFQAHNGTMTKEALAERLGWTKGTTEKVITRLRKAGQLDMPESGHYRLARVRTELRSIARTSGRYNGEEAAVKEAMP